jgi:hypothetical protein
MIKVVSAQPFTPQPATDPESRYPVLLPAKAELGVPGNAKLRFGDFGNEIYVFSVNGCRFGLMVPRPLAVAIRLPT